MPFQPFTPPTNDLDSFVWPSRPAPRPAPAPRAHIPVSGIPPEPRRRIRWWLVLCWFIAFCLFEPVRILAMVLVFFWILSIGMFPHVAVFRVLTGKHKD